MSFKPLTGHMPLIDPLTEVLSNRAVGEPIASIEELLSSKSTSYKVTYSAETIEMLNTANDASAHYYLKVSRGQLVQIVDRVRTLSLDWTTRLEKAGVVGTDFSLTENDKQKAQGSAMHINIGTVQNFTGNLGHGTCRERLPTLGSTLNARGRLSPNCADTEQTWWRQVRTPTP